MEKSFITLTHVMIINDAPMVVNYIAKGIIYHCNMLIVQATGWDLHKMSVCSTTIRSKPVLHRLIDPISSPPTKELLSRSLFVYWRFIFDGGVMLFSRTGMLR